MPSIADVAEICALMNRYNFLCIITTERCFERLTINREKLTSDMNVKQGSNIE